MPADCYATCGSKVYSVLAAATKIPSRFRRQLTRGTWGSDDQGAIDPGTQGRVAIVPYQEGDLQDCANRQAGVDVAVLQTHLGKLLACIHPKNNLNQHVAVAKCMYVEVLLVIGSACHIEQTCWSMQASRLTRKSISAAQINLSS